MSTSSLRTAPFPFIVARGRSGTTLLRAMLDAHPDMAIPNESHFVVRFAKGRSRYETAGGFNLDRFTEDLLDHWAFRRWNLPAKTVIETYEASPPSDYPAAIRTLYDANARHHGKTRYGDKTPSYVISIDLLADTFPEAVFIHLIRDGRDVALSYLDTDFGSRTLPQAAIYWDRYVRAGRASGKRIGPSRYHEVRYEDLVREPEGVLTDLCSFIGLPFDGRMLRYHERADTLVSGLSHREHHRNLHMPPTIALRDWRQEMSQKDVAVFESLAGDLLDELGYGAVTPHERRVSSLVIDRARLDTQARRVAHALRVRGRRLRRRLARALTGKQDRASTRTS